MAAEEPQPDPAEQQEVTGEPPQEEESEKPVLARATSTSAPASAEFQAVPGAPAPRRLESSRGAEWFMEWRYSLNHTDINGPTVVRADGSVDRPQDRSFLHDGVNNIAEYTLLHKRPVWDIRNLETMGIFRYTDDPRVDPEVNSLQRGYLRLSGPTFETTLGDSLVNYSRFTFNQNIKGLTAWKRLPVGPGLRLVGTAGVFQDRWGSIFKGFEEFGDPRQPLDPNDPMDREVATKPFTRLVLGGRAEQYWDENSFLAFSYSQGSDIIRSLPRETRLRPFDNQVVSLETGIRAWRDFSLNAELAFSFTEFDQRIQRDKISNYAGRLEMAHRWGRFSWRVDYARFLPNFFSVNARQVQDLQDASGRASLDLSDQVVLDASFRYTHDNLPGDPLLVLDPTTQEPVTLTGGGRTRTVNGVLQTFPFIVDENLNKMTTFVRAPQVRLTARRLPPSRSLQVSFGYRERQVETSNKTSFRQDLVTGDLLLDPITGQPTPLFVDRVTKISFIDFSWSLRSTLLGLGYEYRHNRDHAQRRNSTFTNRFLASYRGTYFWGDWVVSPSLRFETEPESRQTDPSTLDLQQSLLLQAVTARDQTRTLQSSLIIDFPKYFSLETLYRELNAELLTPFTLTDPVTGAPVIDLVTGQPTRLFGNGGFDRPYFRAALTYRIRDSEDHYIVGSFERSVNTFLTADPNALDSRSFRENVVQVTFVFRWRR